MKWIALGLVFAGLWSGEQATAPNSALLESKYAPHDPVQLAQGPCPSPKVINTAGACVCPAGATCSTAPACPAGTRPDPLNGQCFKPQ